MLVVFLPVVARQAGIGGTRSGTWVNRRIGGIYMEREFYSGSSICFAMIGTMFIAGLVGAGIPNGTHKIGN